MGQGNINLLAVLVSAIVMQLIGMFWYSKSAFGKSWMQLMGLNEKKINKAKKKGMGKLYIISFISSLVLAYILALFIKTSGVRTGGGGATVGFLVWLGFIATVSLGSILWEGKPTKLYFINISYHLVSLLIIGTLLAVWI